MKPVDFTREEITQEYRDRFWSKVDVRGPDDCWEFTGGRLPSGYGHFSVIIKGRKRSVKAHRLAYILEYGCIPDNLFALHRCDNPSCCNPSHIWPGTPLDNMQDMHRKRRGIYGERHHRHKLTQSQVDEIRRSYIPRHPELGYKPLAVKYGVYHGTIARVVRGEFWQYSYHDVR